MVINQFFSVARLQFGHGLQHMLTTVQYSDAAGINNVEWDAVSFYLENNGDSRLSMDGMQTPKLGLG